MKSTLLKKEGMDYHCLSSLNRKRKDFISILLRIFIFYVKI